jgi:type I restriction enzyme S subunit
VPTDNNEASRTKVCNSDLLVSITADIGSVAVVENIAEPAFISQHLAICRFSSTTRVLPRWAAYFLKSGSGRTQFDQKAYGGTKIQLSLDDVREMLVTVPQKEEQQAIVAFLDRKTAKLDALIAEAEGAIELLKERRSALITTTVTGKINVEGVEAAKP